MRHAAQHRLDTISMPEGTLSRLFAERCRRSPDAPAYREHAAGEWHTRTWRDVQHQAGRWAAAFAREGLAPGDRVAVLLPNGTTWVCVDMAAQALGLVVVPLYPTDNAGNLAYILGDSGAKLLVVARGAAWDPLQRLHDQMPGVACVVCLDGIATDRDPLLRGVGAWLPESAPDVRAHPAQPGDLATIVYTSGTTGRPKGVMLSHRNLLSNIDAVLQRVQCFADDLFLSFLSLSHTLERTCGYYLPMSAGACVAFARSVQDLPEDLLAIRPTVLVSVPRVYERIYAKLQQALEEQGAPARALFAHAEAAGWRRFEAEQHRAETPRPLDALMWPVLRHLVADKLQARLGGRLRIAVSGGAPVSSRLMHCFIALGVPILQGYGLTEASPIVSANTLEDNVPDSIGRPVPGVQVRIASNGELLVRGPNVMLGYWNAAAKTREALDPDGWLHTGDIGRTDAQGHLYIAGRLKDILVTSTGEKVPPADLELAIAGDPLFEQVMVLGEGHPFISALVVLNAEGWAALAREMGVDPDAPGVLHGRRVTEAVLRRIDARLGEFPSYARVRGLWLTLEPWTTDNGLITPTLKLRRRQVEERFVREIEGLYEGHAAPR